MLVLLFVVPEQPRITGTAKSQYLYLQYHVLPVNSSFMRKSNMYEKIVRSLSNGAKETAELCKALNIELTGRFSEYLSELELAGFIKRDYTWKLDTGLDAKLSK